MRSRFPFVLQAALLASCGHEPELQGLILEPPGAAIIGRFVANARALTSDPSTNVTPAHPTYAPDFYVDDAPRAVQVAPDGSFHIKELPTGTVIVGVDLGRAYGQIVIDGVRSGEVIQLLVTDRLQSVDIQVTSREHDWLAYNIPSARPGGLQISGDRVTYFLEASSFVGDLSIYADQVRVFSRNADEPCSDRARTHFDGALIIHGAHIEVYDVWSRGPTLLIGDHFRLHDACDGVWVSDGLDPEVESPGGTPPVVQ
jgi:hypothetical protein